jgi:glycerophosphoryl diester phosphodiesterase
MMIKQQQQPCNNTLIMQRNNGWNSTWFVLLIGMFFTACKISPQNNSTRMKIPVFDQQGHRGCRGLMPENTLAAMLYAIDLGVTTLEMDAVITKDLQVILSHEAFFNHEITTKENGATVSEGEEKSLNIFQMDYLETQRYDVGMKLHPRFPQQQKIAATKPLLSNLIDAAENYTRAKRKPPIYYNIETKTTPATDGKYHPPPAEFVDLIMGIIKKKKIQDRLIIQSFDIRTLQYLHQYYPAIQTALLVEDYDKKSFEEQLTKLGFVPTIYSPHFTLVTPQLIAACRQKSIRIIPWTVNDRTAIQQLKLLGVDGVISDYPNLF